MNRHYYQSAPKPFQKESFTRNYLYAGILLLAVFFAGALFDYSDYLHSL